MKRFSLAGLLILMATLSLACSSGGTETSEPRRLMFKPESGDFFFSDSNGNRAIYAREENSLTVETDIDIEELAVAFCLAEEETDDPARFAAVGLVLAEAVIPFVETVERVCER